jgi:hypothetical protein
MERFFAGAGGEATESKELTLTESGQQDSMGLAIRFGGPELR